MTSNDLFNFGAMMSRAAAGPYMSDCPAPATAGGLIDSAIKQVRTIERCVTNLSVTDDPVDEQEAKAAQNCAREAIDKLMRARQLLPATE